MLKKLLLLLLLLSGGIMVYGIDGIPLDNIRKGSGKGHRDITSLSPECYVSNGVVYVVSPDDWSYATVTVTEITSGAVAMGEGFLDETICVALPVDTGSFTVTIVTESGDEFEGVFVL